MKLDRPIEVLNGIVILTFVIIRKAAIVEGVGEALLRVFASTRLR